MPKTSDSPLRKTTANLTASQKYPKASFGKKADDVPLLPVTTGQVPVQEFSIGQEPRELSPTPEEMDQVFAQKLKKFDWAGSWTWEVVSMIFSMVCLAILIWFLKYVNGVEYDTWQYRLSPNTVASAIITVTKAALLISVSSSLSQLKWNQSHPARATPLYHLQVLDQASRGPWGALEVLWRWKMKPGLVTVGALLMVFSLAIDPLAQQLLTYPLLRQKAADGLAYAQSTHAYLPPKWNIEQLDHYDTNPTITMAILSGLFQTNTPLEPVCSTGDCQYSDFASLGICSHCEDVTMSATQVCEVSHQFGSTTFPTTCTYTFPNGYKIKPEVLGTYSAGHSLWGIDRQPWTSVVTSYDSALTPLVSFFSAKYSQPLVYSSHNTTAWEQKPTLTDCSINLCEKQYTNNHYNSTGLRALSFTKSQILTSSPVDSSSDYVGLVPLNGNTTFSPNSTYAVETVSIYILKYMLEDIFNRTLIQDKSGTFTPALFLYSSKNLTESIAQVATAMTDVFRSTMGPGASQIPGEAFEERAIIHVRWGWIAVPVASVVAVGFLLLSTAISSRGKNRILWKASILPLLVGQLRTRPAHDLTSLPPHIDQIMDMSKKVNIVTERNHPLVMVEE
ncbi:uncharacterized protein N7511_004199 [Penicillium nucicola]|uniref:uncharacterized protein n=1 Tax=Penicillium nucicola TaxID=1850975 RepID=UPI0025459241|nr:uncharacterized protein N7511_004199 [Penicillium nucicola]KAJ5766583.1 hypothetical protein N7511_004199 [Penicillium nucicola]